MAYQIKGKNEIKKHAATIHTSGDLSFTERKLVNVLLLNAFDDLMTKNAHSIPVKLLLPLMGWKDSNNSSDLNKALSRLVTTEIKFDLLSENPSKFKTTSFLASGEIDNGICTYEYSQLLARKMANPEIYGLISISMQNNFSSAYTLNLYENCIRFRKVGSTGFREVPVWRELLGATSSMYDDFRHFSNHVIKKAITEINKVSDIKISVEYQRHVRKVSHLKFIIEENRENGVIEVAAPNDESLELIRASTAYKRLRDHGLGDKLALIYVNEQGEEKIHDLVDYVEKRDKSGQIKGSKAGYLRVLVENNAEVKHSKYEKEKLAKEHETNAKINTLSADDQVKHDTFKRIIKEMAVETKMNYVREYFSTEGAGREKYFNSEKFEFAKGEPNIHFNSWLRTKISI